MYIFIQSIIVYIYINWTSTMWSNNQIIFDCILEYGPYIEKNHNFLKE